MNIAIIGLGLIGGSIAIDLRKAGITTRLTGMDISQTNAERALALGLVDGIASDLKAIQQADVVIIAIPVHATASLLPDILDGIGKQTIVMDTGSTKHAICKSANSHSRREQFIATHPIAGTENSGPDAAQPALFAGKTTIVCDSQKSSAQALQTALKILNALNTHPVFMEPEEHDKHVAYVSHLSHVSSFLLGQTVLDIEKDEKNIATLAGSGFASTVRLAKSSPEMWVPIFEHNMEYLSQALQEYIIHLQRFQYHLLKRDTKQLHKTITEANKIRRILEGIGTPAQNK